MPWTSNFIAKTLSTMIISTTQAIFSKKWPTIENNRSLKRQFGKKTKTSEFDLNQWSQRWCALTKMFLIIQREPLQQQQKGGQKKLLMEKKSG